MSNLEKILEIFAEKFEHIVPDGTNAKVLFSLFIQNQVNPEKISYSEQEIKQLIRKYYKKDTATEREQRQRMEERLQTLLRQQFIDKTKDRRIILTDYSLQLCKLFFEKIQPLLNPSEIEKTLEDVKVTLEIRSKSVEDIKHWYENQFLKVLKYQIANQTLAIEYQISELKRDLNERFKVMPFVDLLDYFNQQMEVVIENRRKLTKSFNGLDAITEILANSPLNELSDVEFIQIKSLLNETLDHYKFKLERTGDEISKIKRIASSLFDKIDKKPFYRKLESFFHQILEQSESQKKANRSYGEDNFYYVVDITLPEIVKPISFIKDTPDTFLFPEFHETFSISKNLKSEPLVRNLKSIELAADKSKKRQEQARKVEIWFNSLKLQLTTKNEIDYSDFYMEMLRQEGDIELAIKGTEHILKKLRQENYIVETTTNFSIEENLKDNAIWQVKIKKSFLS
jgi:hypothetical protein